METILAFQNIFSWREEGGAHFFLYIRWVTGLAAAPAKVRAENLTSSKVRIILQWCLHCFTLHALQPGNSFCTICLQEYHHGWLCRNYQLVRGPSGVPNDMKLFTAPICNKSRLFHLSFRCHTGKAIWGPSSLLQGICHLHLSLQQAFNYTVSGLDGCNFLQGTAWTLSTSSPFLPIQELWNTREGR